ATDHFQQAIEKDPSYALAYVGLADCYNVLSSYGISSPMESFPKGKAAAARALEIDDHFAEAHTSLAFLKYWYELDCAGADSERNRALALDPICSVVLQGLGRGLAAMGRRLEGAGQMRRAQELDPLALIVHVNAGLMFFDARQYDHPIEQHRRSLEMEPT